MNKGFISVLTILIIVAASLVTVGSVYTVVKINSLEKENERISEKLIEQKEIIEQEIFSDEISTTTEIVAEEEVEQEIKHVEVVEKQTPTITQQTKPTITVPVEPAVPTAPFQTVDNTAIEVAAKKVEDKKAFDLYSTTLLKAVGELNLAQNQLSEVMRVIYENPTTAKTYATESLNLCSSAHEINLDNTPPKLTFWSDMYELHELSTKESSLCKQIASIYIQMAVYRGNSNYAGASNAAEEAISLREKSIVLSNLKIDQLLIVDKAQKIYFQD